MADQPIIIKRYKKGGHGGHHGGAWKLAYADFVTAMMAFFLLLWLLNSVTQEQLQGIADYFAPTTASQSSSGAGGMLGGQVIGQGAQTSNGSPPSFTLSLPPPTIGNGGDATTDPGQGSTKDADNNASVGSKDGPGGTTGSNPDKLGADSGNGRAQFNSQGLAQSGAQNGGQTASDAAAAAQAAAKEEQQFQQVQAQLRQAINSIPELAKLADSLMVDDTPEGLRIQIVDQAGLAMFPSGSADMYGPTRSLMSLVGKVINQLPEKVSIAGNTDGQPFTRLGNRYTNWELSSDRAQAARRVLADSGVSMSRVERVEGMADSDPLIKENPLDPRNRRLSITLLRQNYATPTDVRVGSQQFQGGQVPDALKGGAPAAAQAPAAASAPPAAAAAAAAPRAAAPAAAAPRAAQPGAATPQPAAPGPTAPAIALPQPAAAAASQPPASGG